MKVLKSTKLSKVAERQFESRRCQPPMLDLVVLFVHFRASLLKRRVVRKAGGFTRKPAPQFDIYQEMLVVEGKLCMYNIISGTAGGRKFRKKKYKAYRNEALVV